MKFYLESLGCPKNLVDAQGMARLLKRLGHLPVDDPGQAQVLVVNTCGFIEDAREESLSELQELARRKRADQVLNHIIKPATENVGYAAVRADAISEPGILTTQVIQHLIDDDLVVADLTGRNPNVFYELAIRHAIRKPIVQIIDVDEPIPFDVSQQRTILVDLHDLDSVANCRSELCKQINIVEEILIIG